MELDEKLVDEVVRLTGEPTRGKAVNKAMAEYVRRRKLDELRKMIGTMKLDYDWEKEEELELADMHKKRQ